MLRRRSEVCQQALRTVSRSHRRQTCTLSPTTASAAVSSSPSAAAAAARRRACFQSGSNLRHQFQLCHGDSSVQSPLSCVFSIPPVPIFPATRNSSSARRRLSLSSFAWESLPSKTDPRGVGMELQQLNVSIKRRQVPAKSSETAGYSNSTVSASLNHLQQQGHAHYQSLRHRPSSNRIANSSLRHLHSRPPSCQSLHSYCSQPSPLLVRPQQSRLYHDSFHTNNMSRKCRSDYDPVLAIMMDRWIQRTLLSGSGRRLYSSLAKPLPNSPVAGEPITSSSLTSTSTSTSTSPTLSASTKAVKETVSTSTATASRSTISESIVKQQQHYNHGVTQSSKNPCSDIQPATPTSIPLTVLSPEGAMAVEKARIVDPSIQNVVNQFQQSLKALNVQDYALPIEFRSLSKEVSHSGKKGFIPGSIRRSIRTLWEDFLVISSDTTGARTSLTAMDYRHFLMAMRYSGKAKESSKMITEMEEILRRAEVPLTRSMAGIVARAHLLQGSVQEAVRVYGEYAQTTNKRSIEHDRMLSVMVDGFVTSQRFSEGTMFLDWVLDTHQDPIFIQELYKRLFSHQLRTKSVLDSYSPKVHGAIRFFNNMTFPPTAPGLVKTLEIIEQDPNCVQLLSSFSQSVAGRLMKMRDRKLMTPLILSLLKANELNEVSRVLRLMQCQGMSPELDQVRVRVLRSMMKLRNTAESESGSATEAEMIARVVEQEGILDQWDWIVQQQGVLGYDTSEKSSIPGFKIDEAGHLAAPQEYGYSQVIAQCLVKEKDVETALQAAQYMRTRGWTARGIDFWKMNSAIVNFVDSSQYGDYLELRYTLGDPAAPDLHTYRRLIYAACRQSDLRSALTLYGQLKARHEDWKLDNTVYNAMISTASAMGLVAVAEKTFQCMIEDGVQPDYYSFHGLLNGYCNQKDLEAAILVPGQMVKWKLEPNVETFNLIIKAYLSIEKPNISTSRRLLKTMQASKTSVPPNLLTFNMLLDGYRRAGNTGWFDHFFDRYFAPPSDPVPESESNSKPMHEIGQESFLNPGGNVDELDAGVHTSSTFSSLDPAHQEQTRAHPQTRQAKTMEARRSETRPGRGNDQTLLVQLKYSLSLPDVDLETVWELWNAIQAKFQKMESPKFKTVYLKPPTFKNRSLTDAEDGSAQGFGTSTMGLKTDKTTGSGSESGQVNESSKSRSLPRTHVPFKRMLGSTLVQATDEEQFQFMVLKVFRDAFEDRGDNRGVNKMEKMQRYIFGSHPDVIQREADRVKSRTMQSGSSSLKSVVKGQGNKGRVGIKKGVKQGGKGFMNGSADSGSWEGH